MGHKALFATHTVLRLVYYIDAILTIYHIKNNIFSDIPYIHPYIPSQPPTHIDPFNHTHTLTHILTLTHTWICLVKPRLI